MSRVRWLNNPAGVAGRIVGQTEDIQESTAKEWERLGWVEILEEAPINEAPLQPGAPVIETSTGHEVETTTAVDPLTEDELPVLETAALDEPVLDKSIRTPPRKKGK
jgi:hypothetical protein